MKQILATIFLMIAVQVSNAAGFYGMVTTGIPTAAIGNPASGSGLAPLHDRILEGSRRIAGDESGTRVTDWSYTPLYLQVTGTSREDSVRPVVAGGIDGNPGS